MRFAAGFLKGRDGTIFFEIRSVLLYIVMAIIGSGMVSIINVIRGIILAFNIHATRSHFWFAPPPFIEPSHGAWSMLT